MAFVSVDKSIPPSLVVHLSTIKIVQVIHKRTATKFVSKTNKTY